MSENFRPQTTEQEIKNRLETHTIPLHSSDAENLRRIRDGFIGQAVFLNARLPDGREKALALTKIEEALMWASKAIAMKYPPIDY